MKLVTLFVKRETEAAQLLWHLDLYLVFNKQETNSPIIENPGMNGQSLLTDSDNIQLSLDNW